MFDFNPEHKNLVAGTDEMPFLFNISRGQRKGSLIFHIKIGIYFYELRLMRVFQSSCSFKCVDKSCKAKSKMVLLDTDLISTKVEIRNNGKQKNLYFVDREHIQNSICQRIRFSNHRKQSSKSTKWSNYLSTPRNSENI